MLFVFSVVQDQLTILFGVLSSAVIVRFTNLYFFQAKFDLQPSVPVIIPLSFRCDLRSSPSSGVQALGAPVRALFPSSLVAFHPSLCTLLPDLHVLDVVSPVPPRGTVRAATEATIISRLMGEE